MTNTSKLSTKDIVLLIFDKDHHFGAAALINSLHNANFEGIVFVIIRDALPNWTSQLRKIDSYTFELSETIHIIFEQHIAPAHFGYFKPQGMLRAMTLFPDARNYSYFDNDIVVSAKWQFFREWMDCGVALCLDSNFPVVHRNHPWRTKWRELMGDDLTDENENDFYINSGFIGIKKQDVKLLELWKRLIEKFGQFNSLKSFNIDREVPVASDQDLLNAAIMAFPDMKFSIIGQEGMGFTMPAYIMSHAVNRVKPWNKNFVRHLLKFGAKPTLADQLFLKYCEGPIFPFSKQVLRQKQRSIKRASMLGRIFG